NATNYFNRGVGHSAQKDLTAAHQDFTDAIRLQAAFPEAYFLRGRVQRDKGQLDRALADYSEALRQNSSITACWAERAAVYLSRGDFLHAANDYGQVLLKNPGDADALYFQAQAHAGLRDYQTGIRGLDRLIALHPNHTAAYAARAELLKLTGKLSESQADLSRYYSLKDRKGGK